MTAPEALVKAIARSLCVDPRTCDRCQRRADNVLRDLADDGYLILGPEQVQKLRKAYANAQDEWYESAGYDAGYDGGHVAGLGDGLRVALGLMGLTNPESEETS